MTRIGLVGASMTFAFLFIVINPAFAQTPDVSEQVTISKDLENNPVAQDILKKIEHTKKWIADLEQKNFEKLKTQKELQEKRAQALDRLERDLKEWEVLWDYYSSENSFARFVEKIPSESTRSIFWDQHEFTKAKVTAGRDALKEVLANGGSFSEARQAYLKAAETKRIELIEYNSMLNVKHNLAYYNQQILFNADGQFDETISGEQLRKYYEDYKTNPSYLQANPDDKYSWDDTGKTNPNTECRVGYVLIHRFHANDYVCVTEYTAEMWMHNGMGSPISDKILVEPKIVDVKKMREDRILEKIQSINFKIKSLYSNYDIKQSDIKKDYDLMFVEMDANKRDEEKSLVKKYNDSKLMTKENFSKQITDIRKKYDVLEKNFIKEKFQSLEILENSYKQNMAVLVKNYDSDPSVKIVWDSNVSMFEAVRK